VLLLFWAGGSGYAQVPRAAPAPPTPKQMLSVLLTNSGVPLSTDKSCQGVGSEPSDATLGDYVSGLLANFSATNDGAKNSIVTSAVPVRSATGEVRWECRVEFVHIPGDDPFRYGVLFQARRNVGSNGLVLVRGSVRCIGGG